MARGRGSSAGTCIGFEVLRGHHDHKADGPLVAEHLVGPPADGAHALHGGNSVVGDEHLQGTGRGWRRLRVTLGAPRSRCAHLSRAVPLELGPSRCSGCQPHGWMSE